MQIKLLIDFFAPWKVQKQGLLKTNLAYFSHIANFFPQKNILFPITTRQESLAVVRTSLPDTLLAILAKASLHREHDLN